MTEPANAEPDVGEPKSQRWARFKRLNHVRLGVALLGLIGLVLGAVVAWRSQVATTLLIVSALLVVLAALGLDWSKIRGTYGGASLELLRERVEEAADRAAQEDDPAELRAEMEMLRAEVEVLATPPTAPRRPTRATPHGGGTGVSLDATIRELFKTKASHAFRGRDTVDLSLRIGSAGDMGYICTVRTPTGEAFTATARGAGAAIIGAPTYRVTYPDEFSGSEPFVPGGYTVEWRRQEVGGGQPLLDLLAQLSLEPVATDSFSIPDLGKPGTS
jgi:cell division protein FtsB